MISRIRSGKFWLKTLSIGTLTVLALEGGARLALHQLIFNSDHIYRSAQTALDGNKRRIRVDADFGRSWFPRPTLTLHNVIISKPGTDTAEIHILFRQAFPSNKHPHAFQHGDGFFQM